MEPKISVVIPAFNEADRIGETLQAVIRLSAVHEIVVVDDGSRDATATIAEEWADRVIQMNQNKGKGHALEIGWRRAKGDILVFLDADLGESASLSAKLIEPVILDYCDMTIAKLPPAKKKGGFGLVKTLADQGVKRLTGFQISAPLSGQRAIRRHLLETIPSFAHHFGIEVSLTVETLRHGFRICEVSLPFQHRESGRDWKGFVHRGRQFVDISRTLYKLWRTTG